MRTAAILTGIFGVAVVTAIIAAPANSDPGDWIAEERTSDVGP